MLDKHSCGARPTLGYLTNSPIRVLGYVAQVSRTREHREREYKYRIHLEVSHKFARNSRLGTTIIYIKKYKNKIIKKK